MNIKKLYIVYFSPTDTTKKTLQNIALGFKDIEVEEINLTPYHNRELDYNFTKDDLVIIGAPVYSGRLPEPVTEILKRVKGCQTLAVPIVVYGNRAYDDSLAELNYYLKLNGFITIAAAAYIAEHSLLAEIATNRPDEKDQKHQIQFAKSIIKTIDSKEYTHNTLIVKGNIPEPMQRNNKLVPQSTAECTNCGVCSTECPMLAIDSKDFNKTDVQKCILCFRCVRLCKQQARVLQNEVFNEKIKNMAKKLTERKQPEIFLI
ncbi:4Fe-4S dicluster domain-containing protein [Clostridium sp. 'deep sea']|uniref:4Fe-4S dicluster domain-containing protein n=1 Tax=Clostridium sp. 'deep sea' TaxID=2779445 RepID=UPI0018964F4D|nr:4Fe-4S dicluster domain-containing protein [Clostridium sp. 'deep sea']QOR34214.1 4Fe-4S dicluster domain-containing protein [Clostridium sp. 'deep sea']